MLAIRFAFLFTIILSIKTEKINALKILGIFPLPGKSHFTVGEHLLKELAHKGHSVDVVSHFPQNKIIKNYNDLSLAGSAPLVTSNLTFAESQEISASTIDFMVKTLGDNVCDLLSHSIFQELIKRRKGTYDVIIVELFFSPCYLAFGQQLGAPIVGLVACKMHDWLYKPFGIPLNPSYIPSIFLNLSQHMTFWEKLKNTLVTKAIDYRIDYHSKYQIKLVEKYFNRKLSSINELYNDVAIVLVNEHFSINDVKPMTPDIIEVGGLHVHDSDQKLTVDLKKWLDTSNEGCVLFSFGSMIKIESMPQNILEIFYESFKKIAPIRVLMKMTDASVFSGNLPENVRISPWLPQVAVLKHNNTKAFVTHGGTLGTQEALAYKVPMIGLPLFADQHNNIQNYAHHNIAVALSLDTLTVEAMTNAVNTVLKDPAYRQNIEKLSDRFFDRPMSAMNTAVYWVEYSAKHGTVIKSPAIQLYWWQINSLDVYGFLLIIFLMFIFTIKKLLALIWGFLRNKSLKKVSKAKKNK